MGTREQILAGDVGGTKTLLALFDIADGQLHLTAAETYQSPAYAGLEAVVLDFRRQHPAPLRAACLGLPGPVTEGRVITPNLAWEAGVELGQLEGVLAGVPIILLNDLEATGYGLRVLRPEQFARPNPGRPRPQANAALIAAGTGLGEAILFWDGQEHRPSASEGGHCDFAPRTELEVEFFRYALGKLGRVSFDRVVSGRGLLLLHEFLRDTGRGEEPGWLAEKLTREDPAAVISEAALEKNVPLCAQALEMFVSVYGAEAGNLALKALARAGVYLGGGIAPKILPKLTDGTFVRAFTDKGRLSGLVAEIPVSVILEPHTALYGAAYFAARQARFTVTGPVHV